MGETAPDDFAVHRPGAISAFFVYKAGVFAACFWGWLGVLAVRGDSVSGWHVVAASGAITTTLVGVVLGARFALQRNAAIRHEQVFRALVDISWNAFAQSGRSPEERPADVIHLPKESRQRPRR